MKPETKLRLWELKWRMEDFLPHTVPDFLCNHFPKIMFTLIALGWYYINEDIDKKRKLYQEELQFENEAKSMCLRHYETPFYTVSEGQIYCKGKGGKYKRIGE